MWLPVASTQSRVEGDVGYVRKHLVHPRVSSLPGVSNPGYPSYGSCLNQAPGPMHPNVIRSNRPEKALNSLKELALKCIPDSLAKALHKAVAREVPFRSSPYLGYCSGTFLIMYLVLTMSARGLKSVFAAQLLLISQPGVLSPSGL